MSFLKQAGLTILNRGLILIISFIYNIVLTQNLGAEGVGIVGACSAFVNTAVYMGNLGVPTSMVYYIGVERGRGRDIAGTGVTFGFIASIVLFAIFAMIAFIAPGIIGDIPRKLYVVSLLSISPLLLALLFQNILLAHQRIVTFNVIELSMRFASLVGLILIAMLIRSGTSTKVVAVIWLTVGYSAFLACANGIMSWRASGFKLGIDGGLLRRMLSYGWKSYYGILMTFLVLRTDVMFLNAMRSQAETGIYRQVVWTTDMIYLLPVTISTLLFPKLMQEGAAKERGADERSLFTMFVARLTAFALFAVSVFLWLFGREFLSIFGPEFPEGYIPLCILVLAEIFLGVNSIIFVELQRRGLPLFVIVTWTACLMVKIGSNVLLVPRYGMLGTAWSSLAAYLVLFSLALGYCVRHYGFSVWKTLIVQRGDFKLVVERVKAAFER